MLRHDWKIRQLSQQLTSQENTIHIATGILKASLTLQSFKGMPNEMLKESFEHVRQALLFNKEKSSNIGHKKNDNSEMLNIMKKLSKKT